MSIRKMDDGSYKVDIRPNGRYGRRIQRLFKKKADALAFERYVLSHMNDKEWLEKPADHRRISELLSCGGNLVDATNHTLTMLN